MSRGCLAIKFETILYEQSGSGQNLGSDEVARLQHKSPTKEDGSIEPRCCIVQFAPYRACPGRGGGNHDPRQEVRNPTTLPEVRLMRD